MPLFEVETTSHIMIACADDETTARGFAANNTRRGNHPRQSTARATPG